MATKNTPQHYHIAPDCPQQNLSSTVKEPEWKSTQQTASGLQENKGPLSWQFVGTQHCTEPDRNCCFVFLTTRPSIQAA